jgi:hypothetical protein
MYRIITCLLLIAYAPAALAGDVELTLGKFTVQHFSYSGGEQATQVVAAKNNGAPIAHLVNECAFMRGTEFLDNGRGVTFNVDTGKTILLRNVRQTGIKAVTMICSRATRECCAFPEKSTHLRS